MKFLYSHLGFFLAFTVLLVQLIILPAAGMTWDEPSSFFFGRANLRFWQTFNRAYIDDFKNPELFQGEPFEYIYGEDVYPPFSFLVASAVSLVLAETFQLMSVIDAHHLGQMLIGIVAVWAMYRIAVAVGFTKPAAAGITLLYATYPTIIAQMRNDAKDVPLMSMIVLCVYFVISWVKAVRRQHTSRHLYGLLAAITLGLAQGTKVSAAIIVPILAVWFGVSYLVFKRFRKEMGSLLHRGVEAAVFGLVALVSFIGIWPWLWADPIGRLQQVFNFFKVVGFGMPTLYFGEVYQAGINLPWHYPLGIFVSQTPPTLLPLLVVGIVVCCYRVIWKRDVFALLFLLWFLIGIGRFFIPGVLIYAKIRHYIDAMPPVFLISGYGAVLLGQLFVRAVVFLREHTRNDILPVFITRGGRAAGLLLGIVVLHQSWIIVTHAPYEPSYFSVFAGGTKHAAEKHLFDVEYWASAVKEGMEAIDAQTEGPTTVYACTMAHLAVFYETEKVQVKLTPWEAQYILIPNSYSWFGGPAEHAKQHHTLFHTVERMGAPLLWVYKFRDPAFWNCGYETVMNYTF